MAHQIVVSCRLGHGAIAAGGYLERARTLMTRAEALGATLVAWSATTLAFAWDPESIEEAIVLATSLREGVSPANEDHAWACGVAEGEMHLVAPNGQRANLAWGEPLVAAVSLARIAKPGEVLLDGDVRAVRVGELSLHGSRVSTDAGKRVRGWRLDVGSPWRRASSARVPMLHTPESQPASIDDEMAVSSRGGPPPSYDDLATTQENAVPTFSREELAAGDADVFALADRHVTASEVIAGAPEEIVVHDAKPRVSSLEEKIRVMARVDRSGPDALAALRRARADAEAAGPGEKCHAALALAVALGLAGRADEALVEGMDALARAREAGDAKALHACFALLSKLYAGAGRLDDAERMRSVG